MRIRRASVLSLIPFAMTLSCAHAPRSVIHERTDEEAAVLAAVERFFATMTSSDAAGARVVLDPEGDFVSVRWNEAGERVVRRSSNREYLEGLAAGTKVRVERMWEPEVSIHPPIAIVWTRYDFHTDGKFSHCGVDAFQLLQTEVGWIITGGTYTVEQTGCRPSPLGPLGP